MALLRNGSMTVTAYSVLRIHTPEAVDRLDALFATREYFRAV